MLIRSFGPSDPCEAEELDGFVEGVLPNHFLKFFLIFDFINFLSSNRPGGTLDPRYSLLAANSSEYRYLLNSTYRILANRVIAGYHRECVTELSFFWQGQYIPVFEKFPFIPRGSETQHVAIETF